MISVIDHRHAAAKATGTVMVVMIGRAWFIMRIAGTRVFAVMIVTVLVGGGHDIAWIGRKRAAVHADECAEHQDDLEEDSHNDEPKIGDMADGSRHFGPGPFLDIIRHRGFVATCLLPMAIARCGRF